MRSVPRFSHSSDFSDLFSSNQQEVSDYAQGLLFIGCFLLTVFVIWFIILLVLKCTPGAGFLAGHRFTNRTRASHVRIVFSLAAVLSMLFTILLVTEGITNLQDTLTTVDNSNQVSCFWWCCMFVYRTVLYQSRHFRIMDRRQFVYCWHLYWSTYDWSLVLLGVHTWHMAILTCPAQKYWTQPLHLTSFSPSPRKFLESYPARNVLHPLYK